MFGLTELLPYESYFIALMLLMIVIIFGEYFKREIKVLNEFTSDGLLTYNESNIVLSENGKHFSNLIGSIFDSFIKTSRYNEKIKIN